MNVISLFSGCSALRGIEDARGQLFFDYIRILKEFRPRFFLAEEAGYDVSLTMVNAKNYGVAEERKRVFYIGFRNDLHIDFVFPKGSTEDDEKKLTLRHIIWDLQFLPDRKTTTIRKQSTTTSISPARILRFSCVPGV